MNQWFRNLGYKYQELMRGRYGMDEFSRFLSIAALVCMFVSWLPKCSFFYVIALALLVWSIFRQFSKDLFKRNQERIKYLQVKEVVMQKYHLMINRFKYRKTHRYYKCPNCKKVVRVRKPPKGKTIMITCTNCNRAFQQKT